MSRIMYDGVNALRIPLAVRVVGGYVDGAYTWSDADWARFPNAVKVRIAVFASTNDGHVLDVEPGNATPAQSVDWVLMRRKAGADPTVYMNTSTWPVVRAAFQARGVAEPHYWVAQYDGNAVIPAGAVAKQYYNNDTLGYDLSVVADYLPGIDPAPEADVIDQQSIDAIAHLTRDLVMNVQLGETDLAGKQTGSTISLGQATARARAAQADVDAKLAAVSAQLAKLGTGGIDLNALEALIEQHLATGSAPAVIAAAVLQHLSAATAGAKP